MMTVDELAALVRGVFQNVGDRMPEVTQETQEYPVVDMITTSGENGIFKADNDGGATWQRSLIGSGGSPTVASGPFEEDDLVIDDADHLMTGGWAGHKFNYAYDAREKVFNGNQTTKILDVIKQRRTVAYLNNLEYLDLELSVVPATTTKNVTMGIPGWVPGLSDAQATAGFFGGSPSGWTTIGGLAPETSGANTNAIAGGVARHRSYAVGGTGYYGTAVDLTAFESMKTMFRQIGFKSPKVPADVYKNPFMARFKLLANAWFLNQYERFVDARNENFGADAAKFFGATAFKGLPITWWPKLDADMRDPLYMLNLNSWEFLAPDEFWRKTTGPVLGGIKAHSQVAYFVDSSYALICRGRRRQGVMRKTAART